MLSCLSCAKQPSAIQKPMQIGFYTLSCLSCARQPSAIQKADADRLLCASIGCSESRSSCCLPPVMRPGGLYLTHCIPCMQEPQEAHLPGWTRSNQVTCPQAQAPHAHQGVCQKIFDLHLGGTTMLGWAHHEPGCQARPLGSSCAADASAPSQPGTGADSNLLREDGHKPEKAGW
jgi:hypothetical protein